MRHLPLCALLASLSACAPSPADQPADTAQAPKNMPVSSTSTCPDKAARLPGTGLCPTDAAALLPADDRPSLPDGCAWSVSETALPGDTWLLYRAARCDGKTAALAYAPAKPLARLVYALSPMGGDQAKGATLVVFAPADRRDPQSTILALTRAAITDPADDQGCHVRKADIPGWPADALVVDIPADEAAKMPQDEIRGACGPLGLDQGSQLYWRISQGHVWHFDLGQELPEIDPRSLTLIRKDASGEWAAIA
ncbi:hypothetical protein [Sphingobium sp. Z007]|uniref:hypothetical protein n=1 Tax=Sphingobium sp. Z007 TaxID=627495 RepID=UPI000B4989AE|nr:hypothetical protein [Sphingobium sp. Z007]